MVVDPNTHTRSEVTVKDGMYILLGAEGKASFLLDKTHIDYTCKPDGDGLLMLHLRLLDEGARLKHLHGDTFRATFKNNEEMYDGLFQLIQFRCLDYRQFTNIENDEKFQRWWSEYDPENVSPRTWEIN